MNHSWLKHPVKDNDKACLTICGRTTLPLTTMLKLGKVIDEYRTKIEPGDELWIYRSPPETWKRLCGESGIAIIRGSRKKVVGWQMLCLN